MWLKDTFFVFYILIGTFFYKGITLADNIQSFEHGNSDIQDFPNRNDLICPDGFYLARDICYKIVKKPYLLVNSANACDYIENTTYVNRKCECAAHYYFDNDHCYKIPSGPNDPVDSAEACEYIRNSIYTDGKCKCFAHYYFDTNRCFKIPENPYKPADTSEGCKYIENTTYIDGMCHCSVGYYYDSKHCYKIPSGPNAQVDSAKACLYLQNTVYSNGKCVCSPNYYSDVNHCFRIPEKPYESVDTPQGCKHLNNTTYSNGTCHCSLGYYHDGDRCLKIPSGPNIQVDSAKACDYLPNTTYSNGRCECLSKYYLDGNHCYKIPTTTNTRVDSAKACNYLDDGYFSDGQCVDFWLGLFPRFSEDYEPSFSDCSDNGCRCKSNYFGANNNKCYGFLGAKCSSPSDCLSSSYSCVSGTCQKVEYQQGLNVLSSKPGISAYWTQDKSIPDSRGVSVHRGFDYICRGIFKKIALPGGIHNFYVSNKYCDVMWGSAREDAYSYELLIGPNVEWKKSPASFDKAIYGGHTKVNKPILICRPDILWPQSIGYLLPPFYDTCFSYDHGSSFNYNEFSVLVEK